MASRSVRALVALSVAGWMGLAAAATQSARTEDRADGGSPAPPADGGTRAADGGAARDPDQEVIDHLDELEQLDLLQQLGLLDPSGEDEAPATPQPKGTSR